MTGGQQSLFGPTGKELKNIGMERAIDHADNVHNEWSDRAFNFLYRYAQKHLRFMAEDIRISWEEYKLPMPPSKRAWGSVINRAKSAGIIQHYGYGQVKNPTAHRANASVWQSKIYSNG